MSAYRNRRRQALTALGLAFALMIAGLAALGLDGRPSSFTAQPASLTPLLTALPEFVTEISISTNNDSFTLRRTLEGWAMASHDGYVADADLADQLIAAVASIAPVGERTRRPERYFRLDLGDPANNGAGAHIIMRDNNDRPLADIVVGRQRSDGFLYLRRAGEMKSWLARGFMPEFAARSNWMDLDFLSLGRSNIREACILPPDRLGYCLQRTGLSTEVFDLPSPRGWVLVSPGAGDGVATTLSRIRFRDARRISEIRAPVVAEHRVTTVNGLEVTLFIHDTGDGLWARIVAVAHSDAARANAISLNERADGWAFELSDLSADRLMRPLSGIAMPTDPAPR
ncbi:MAG: hypothetical protein DHS20C06_03830 [Hyphobacterium sp.]|nr:MAG: hypothetical protein DHS20C06_03830 [Hyphobacterium sp.]